jgi:hypothetical protein
VADVSHTIDFPVEVTPRAPAVVQNAPADTPCLTGEVDGFVVVRGLAVVAGLLAGGGLGAAVVGAVVGGAAGVVRLGEGLVTGFVPPVGPQAASVMGRVRAAARRPSLLRRVGVIAAVSRRPEVIGTRRSAVLVSTRRLTRSADHRHPELSGVRAGRGQLLLSRR